MLPRGPQRSRPNPVDVPASVGCLGESPVKVVLGCDGSGLERHCRHVGTGVDHDLGDRCELRHCALNSRGARLAAGLLDVEDEMAALHGGGPTADTLVAT